MHERFTEHWEFCKKNGFDEITLDLKELETEHGADEQLGRYERFAKHDLSHWDECIRRRKPTGDAVQVWICADGWPLEMTSLDRVWDMDIAIQYFGSGKYGS